MKKLIWMTLAAGALAGCMPTRSQPPKGAETTKKEAEGTTDPAVPLVTRDSINEYNAGKRAQAMADELDRDEKKPVKVLVEARK